MNESVYQGYRLGFSAQFGLATHFSLAAVPPASTGFTCKQRLKGFCATAGTVLSPLQGGNRGNPLIRPWARLFQLLFSFAKEGRRSTTYSRPVSSELLPLQREVQDDDIEDYYVTDSSSSPAPLCIDAFTHPWPDMRLYAFPPVKLIPAVLCRMKESGVRLLLVAPFWPSQTWFSELIPLLYWPPWEIPIRQELLSQLQGKIWHPQPKICKLWVWPIQGHRFWLLVFLLRFRRLSLVPEPPPLGSCTLPNGRSLSLGV